MVEAESFAPRAGSEAIHSLLTLLSQDRPDRTILLVRKASDGSAHIEDAYPRTSLTGCRIAMPADLLCHGLVSMPTDRVRLSAGWIDTCGDRPRLLSACPVPGHPMWLLVADCEVRPSEGSSLPAAAQVLAPLLDLSQGTRDEHVTALRLGGLIDNLPGPLVFVDARRLQVFLNDGARDLLDLQSGDLRESSVATALARLVAGTGTAATKPQLAMDPTASMTFDVEHGDRAFTVETHWIDEQGLAGRIWQFRDITQERAYQSQLSDLAALLQLTVENVHEGVALIDENLRLILWNADFLHLFGYPDEHVIRGSDLLSLLRISAERGELGVGEPDTILDLLVDSIRSAPNRRLEIRREDGRILDLWRRSLEGGRFILVVRDVTDERQMARLKDDLVSTASHELRTPVTAILGSLRLVLSGMAGALPETAQSLLEIASKNAGRLDRLINDLLDLDKLQLGKMTFERETVDLSALLADAAEQNAPYADRHGVSIIVETQAAVSVQADPFRLMQVMANLLSNAAKFSPEGTAVRVVLSNDDGWAKISVIDHGRGISPEFRKRLFTRFAQEDVASPDRPAGSGLGLAISKSIIEAHGGTIAVDPDTGVGTTFHITLPLI